MRDLYLSRLERGIVIDGKTFYVEPPTIRDTCELFVCRSGCLALEASYVHAARAALRRWWGQVVMEAAHVLLYPPSVEGHRILYDEYVIPMALQGCPVKQAGELNAAGKKTTEEEARKSAEAFIDEIVQLDMRRKIALYCTVFPAADPQKTYETMPFSMFIGMFEEVDRMIAYHQYERLYAESLMRPSEDTRAAEQRLSEYAVRAGLQKAEAVHAGAPRYSRKELEEDPAKMEEAKRYWMGAVNYAQSIGMGGPQTGNA